MELMAKVNETSTLEAAQQLLAEQRKVWLQFRDAVNERRVLPFSTEEADQFNKLVPRVQEKFNIAEQTLEEKITKLTPEAAVAATSNSPTSDPITPEITKIKEEKLSSDAAVLQALIKQIGEQFQEILKGNYARPIAATNEPMLGTAHSSTSDENENTPPTAVFECITGQGEPQATARANTRPSPNQIQQPTVELKMDKFQLPTFDGHLMQWLPFRDQFIDLVDKNPRYSSITKFIHLRGHLTGSALEAINGFTLSAANYEAAWYILQRRYNKPDKIIDEYLRSLDTLPIITHPNAERLIAMVNCANQILRVLPVLGVDVTTWDTIIKYKLTSKLDRATHKKWLDQVKLRQNVPLTELIEFLEVEASESISFISVPSGPAPARPPFHRSTRRQPPVRSAVLSTTTEKPSPREPTQCAQCKQYHELFRCPTFRGMAVKDRLATVKGAALCRRCLRSHPYAVPCKLGPCPKCNADHNLLLCYQFEKEKNLREARQAARASNPSE